MSIFRRPPLIVGSAVRGSKKFVLIIVLLIFVSAVVVFQYRETKQLIIYRNIVGQRIIATDGQLNRFVPVDSKLAIIRALSASDNSTSKHVEEITPQAKLQKLINATKTLYPITINAAYLIENPTLCSSVSNLTVLVIVHTAPSHFERRLAIRKTWTNESYYSHLGKVRVLFLLGRVKDYKLQLELETEFKKHHDLLQGDFIDAYRNLTHKGVMAYKWVSERCRNAQYILKVDDDITVNMYKMFTQVLPSYKGKTKQIMCNHIRPGTMLIIRDKKSKWYVDTNYFRAQKFYPRYCSGFLVLFTNDAMPALFRASSLTPFFWVDDVYLYGLVPSHVPGIQYNDLKKGSHQLNGQLALKCYNNASKTCDFLVSGAGKASVSEEIWYHMGIQYEQTKQIVINMETPRPTSTTADYNGSTNKTLPQVVKPIQHTDKVISLNGKQGT